MVVVVRAPGRVVRRLQLGRLRVARNGRRRTLEVAVANRGNVTETLEHARALISLSRRGRRLATLAATSRDLRPRTSGILDFPFRARVRAPVIVRVVIPAEGARSAVSRAYRIRT